MASLQYLCSCSHHQHSIRSHEFRVKKFNMRRYCIRCEEKNENKRLRVLIASGGIGGLVLALAAKHRGFDVKVFEKGSSAVRGEGRDRGPIQLSSNAMAVLEAIDKDVARQIVEAAGCITGNRINGFADGLSGKWGGSTWNFNYEISLVSPNRYKYMQN